MIHYHGTPVSGTRQDACRFLAGRHALVPFARPDDLGIALEACQSVVLDNSAFSNWRSGGGDVDVAAYHSWVQSVAGHPAIDWCLIPDKIDGTEKDNVELVALWLRMGCRVLSVPVWHLHESLEWLDHLVGSFQTVAIGSSGPWSDPGTDRWWARMSEAMHVACDAAGRPRARLHGLRMLDPEIFRRLPLASADSTNAAVNGGAVNRFGMYPAPTAGQRAEVIASRIEAHQSAPAWESPGQQPRLFLGDTA
ncbi:TPA: hypothetical protein UM509_000749 [Stenotrophomonas maltophilia]|uniref:hypothetical protein n=1 Tax=Stenotrophomonas maltophilia TaxID=40324 RepID=UPI000B518D5C|nr:hypothetical protein [Stenotrophomonas maltophilia]ASE54750.1 hypothetical protein CEQ03_19720 [Stenotrophomonas maltophilia]HEL4187068.1 hypothetical protein [Stenotrophomonas maltophilia]HEL4403684.1 hypothetical protein [Stenotrophomonas maltophilia]HEL4828943.1 hypothetical protein [Stenotrophomonas maltophilia]HEL5081969.1 hypothetical protein [Stenotrophomonas maltophilia]